MDVDIPLLDISRWRAGAARQRAAIAARADRALRSSGFLLVEGHGIAAGLMADLRAAASEFFALPAPVKQKYATPVGGRGWIPQGQEANAYYGQVADATRADLKESLTNGRPYRTGDAATDAEWFTPNVWPAEVPGLEALAERFAEQARLLNLELLAMCAAGLGLAEDWFARRSLRAPYTFNINRYPPLTQTGTPLDGQFRVAPHTDWGMLTILDRQPGYGGLQVQLPTGGGGDRGQGRPAGPDGEWVDAPFHPGALTINVGDILARWTGDRWRSTRHRVLPPPPQAPSEELVSLIMFMEADMDTVVAPLLDGTAYEPVLAGDWLRERTQSATVRP